MLKSGSWLAAAVLLFSLTWTLPAEALAHDDDCRRAIGYGGRKSDCNHCDLRNCDFGGSRGGVSSVSLNGSYIGSNFSGRGDFKDVGLMGNFSGANFSGADLSYAQMTRGNFAGANFSGAKLVSTFTSGANMRGANFTGATLQGRYFSGVNFSGARFSNTQTDAVFGYCNFSGANMRGMVWGSWGPPTAEQWAQWQVI